MNSIVLERYYTYSKRNMLLNAYTIINAYYNGTLKSSDIEIDLEKMSFSNDFDILIKTNTSIYATSKDFISSLTDVEYNRRRLLNENILYDEDKKEDRQENWVIIYFIVC